MSQPYIHVGWMIGVLQGQERTLGRRGSGLAHRYALPEKTKAVQSAITMLRTEG